MWFIPLHASHSSLWPQLLTKLPGKLYKEAIIISGEYAPPAMLP
jgi:hypothetical protein